MRSNKYIALESEIIQIWRVCNMGLFDKFKKQNKNNEETQEVKVLVQKEKQTNYFY